MGIRARPPKEATSIADALFSKVQQRVLGILFGNPGRSFYANELIRQVGSGTGAVQRELSRLLAAKLIVEARVGNQRHFRANAESPVFSELRSIAAKTSGVGDALRASLQRAAPGIKVAFIFGSVAKGTDTASSDIDLMIVDDDLSYTDVFPELEKASARLGRKINPTIYTANEFKKRLRQRNAFITRTVAGPKIWLAGSEDDIAP